MYERAGQFERAASIYIQVCGARFTQPHMVHTVADSLRFLPVLSNHSTK